MPVFVFHLDDGPTIAPRTEEVEAHDEEEARALAHLRLTLSSTFTHVEVERDGVELSGCTGTVRNRDNGSRVEHTGTPGQRRCWAWMPMYHFISNAGPSGATHPAELELPSLRDAQYEAVRYLGELLREDGAEFWIKQSATMSVTDERGEKLFTLELALA